MAFHPDDLPNLKGKVFIVTGGNSGIGYHTVSHLASRGAHVYLCSRSPSKGVLALSSLRALHPTLTLQITLLPLDLASLPSILTFTQKFLSLSTSLHGLINNAGIMATPFTLTNDGYEAQFQTNYLAHWLLTTRLLPVLLKTSRDCGEEGGVRIVNVTSSGHLGAPKEGINFDDLTLGGKEGGKWARYGQSKLANILHTATLHKLYGPGSPSSLAGKGEIWTTSVHPGLVETNLATGVEGVGDGGWFGFERIVGVLRCFGAMRSAEMGSWSSLFCAAGSMGREEAGAYVEVTGRWGEPWWRSACAKDGELAENLEKWSRETMEREGWVEMVE